MVRRTKSIMQSKGNRDAVEAVQPSEGVTQSLERVTQAHVGAAQSLQGKSKIQLETRVFEPTGLKPDSSRS